MTADRRNAKKIISILTNLIETCRNGQYGFATAAYVAKDLDLAGRFTQYALQRRAFADALQRFVLRLGGKVEDSGTAVGAAHRAWLGIKSAVTGGDVDVVIVECEKGEAAALKLYEEALKEDLPSSIRSVIERQQVEIRSVYENIRSLSRNNAVLLG